MIIIKKIIVKILGTKKIGITITRAKKRCNVFFLFFHPFLKKKTIKFMNLYFIFGKNLVLYGLRAQILIIYFFFLTPGYFLFILFVIFGKHCTLEESLLHIFSHFIVNFTLCSTFFFIDTIKFFLLWKNNTIF